MTAGRSRIVHQAPRLRGVRGLVHKVCTHIVGLKSALAHERALALARDLLNTQLRAWVSAAVLVVLVLVRRLETLWLAALVPLMACASVQASVQTSVEASVQASVQASVKL